jgi:hypothetical protein
VLTSREAPRYRRPQTDTDARHNALVLVERACAHPKWTDVHGVRRATRAELRWAVRYLGGAALSVHTLHGDCVDALRLRHALVHADPWDEVTDALAALEQAPPGSRLSSGVDCRALLHAVRDLWERDMTHPLARPSLWRVCGLMTTPS